MAEPSAAPSPASQVARPFLVDAIVVVVVLGVLPFLWDSHLVWRLLGPLAATAVLSRAAVLVWRSAFSTSPRDMTPPG